MSLPPPVKVGKLQTALHTKAKDSPDYRFYALYDKVYRRDVLEWAFVRCLRNGGVPGVDGQSFEDIEKYGTRPVARRTGGRTQKPDVSAPAGPARVHPQRRMASKGRWASRASGTAWCRRLRC